MKKALCFASLMAMSATAQAELYFQDFSVTALRGADYELGDNNRTVATFEYANAASWGDTFFFVDRLESFNGDSEIYGEFSPRFNIMQVNNGPLKAISVATTWEFGNDSNGFSQNNYLAGVGTAWNIPMFSHFGANVYQRFNDNDQASNQQFTLTWGLPIPFSKTEILFDGFIDWTSGTRDQASQFNFTPQIKLDIAPWVGAPGKLYVGFEYVYWNNKFGVHGVDERNLNALVKYHF
ncbi:DUF5020 family protein [Paraferrimonas haliotis]|uniref:Ion channel protein Tsx n=1 Tax=Paraferrimonas haliotis TaxID=2013866 RepID=A0AA37TL03_9GAMM|nr:DUF5020 family protein [Paraferrimonas haliotis]GLS82453.1 ion channel protein Tsx [Paraferrimonas haliotis]